MVGGGLIMANFENKPSKELVAMLNKALEMEHQAYVQYLSHAELLQGLDSEPIEARHQGNCQGRRETPGHARDIIGKMLGEVPSMGFAPAHKATETKEILKVNLAGEGGSPGTLHKNVDQNKAGEGKSSFLLRDAKARNKAHSHGRGRAHRGTETTAWHEVICF